MGTASTLKTVALALLAVAAACQPTPTGKPPDGSFGPVLFEDPIDLAWGSGAIFVVGEGEADVERSILVQVHPDSGAHEQLALERNECLSVSPLSPQAIDDRLIFVLGCDTPGERRISLVEHDQGSGDVHEIIHDIPFPPRSYGTPDRGETWFASDSSGICAWISRISGEAGPWPVTITDGRRPFELDEGFEGNCDNLGMASNVAVSDDGSLAFVASPDALGVSGAARTDVRWNVYTIDPTDSQPRLRASGFMRPTDLRWVGDSGSIELAAVRGGRSALWEVNEEGAVSIVVDAPVINFSREPAGSRIAVTMRVGNPVEGGSQLRLWIPAEA